MATAQIELPEKLIPIFQGEADVRGADGGRGSAKTRTFAKMSAVRGYMYGKAGIRGLIVCGRQFMNSLADSSLEEIKRAIEEEPWLLDYYEIGQNFVKSKDGMIEYAFIGLDRNIQSVKSKGRMLLFWIDEAEPVTNEAFTTLIPTLREEGTDWNAELWVTWNQKRKTAAVQRFKNSKDPRIKIATINWRDNKKFPAKLERERQRDLIERPDQYEHIWEGDFINVIEGAYWAKNITQAKLEGRIGGNVAADPLMQLRAFVDIGGTGAKADAFTMWIVQFINREIRILDYYEAVGQDIGTHLTWLRNKGYVAGKLQFWLPHDGSTQDKVIDVSYQSALISAGYAVEIVPNQGKGAASARVESARRIFGACWFDNKTSGGVDALGWYHEKKDEVRGIGLGPEHDWSSHASDSFGMMAIVFESLGVPLKAKPIKYTRKYLA